MYLFVNERALMYHLQVNPLEIVQMNYNYRKKTPEGIASIIEDSHG